MKQLIKHKPLLTQSQILSRLNALKPIGEALAEAEGAALYHISTSGDYRACCIPSLKSLEINLPTVAKRLIASKTRDIVQVDASYLSCVLHELVHIKACEAGIYSRFHDAYSDVTASGAVRAEKWVDRQAKAWYELLGFAGEYEDSYLTHPENIKWLREKYK